MGAVLLTGYLTLLLGIKLGSEAVGLWGTFLMLGATLHILFVTEGDSDDDEI
jgi:hypothetical protein